MAERDSSEVSNRDVARGAGTTLLARMGGVLDVLIQPLYVWLFGLAGYGFYGALWAAINLAENASDFGMTSALQRIIPQTKSKAEEASALRAAFLMGVIPGVIIATIVSLSASKVAHFFNAAAHDEVSAAATIALFAWALPLWAFIEISTSALRSKRLFGAEIRLRLFWEQVLRAIFVVLLYLAGVSTRALFFAHLASLSLICLLCVRLLSKHFELRLIFCGRLRDDVFVELFKAGMGVWPVNITTRLFADGPALALNALIPGSSGAVATSLYIIARKISSVVQLVRTAFAYVLAPLASAATAEGGGQVKSIYGYATRLSLALALPLGVQLAAQGPALLSLFGPGADAALLALVIMLTARVVEAITGAATPIQQVTSRHFEQQIGSYAGLVAAAALAWGLLPRYGLDAMALAVGVGLVLAAIFPLFQLHIIDKLHPFEGPFGGVALRSGAVAAGGVLVSLAVESLHPAQFIAHLVPSAGPVIPNIVEVLLLLPFLIATLWASLRISLPYEDRVAIGPKTAKALRLI